MAFQIGKFFKFEESRSIDFQEIFILLLLIIGGFTIYSNTLKSEFCYDDYFTIVNNPAIKDMSDLGRIWDTFNTRFMVGLSFALNYQLSKFDVASYHIFNIIVHILSSFLVYYAVLLTFQTPALEKSFLTEKKNTIALFSALIFLSHPIQTEGVAYITQRATSLATFFYLLSLFLYLKNRLEERPLYLFGAIVTTVLGLLTKEITFTIPITLTAYEFFFFGSWKINSIKRIKILLPFFFTLGIIPLLLNRDFDSSYHFIWRYNR